MRKLFEPFPSLLLLLKDSFINISIEVVKWSLIGKCAFSMELERV